MKYKACPECSQDLTTCPTDCQPEWIPSPRYRNRNSSPGTNRNSFSSWYNSKGLVKKTGQKIRCAQRDNGPTTYCTPRTKYCSFFWNSTQQQVDKCSWRSLIRLGANLRKDKIHNALLVQTNIPTYSDVIFTLWLLHHLQTIDKHSLWVTHLSWVQGVAEKY